MSGAGNSLNEDLALTAHPAVVSRAAGTQGGVLSTEYATAIALRLRLRRLRAERVRRAHSKRRYGASPADGG
jgi:hypothetical protein